MIKVIDIESRNRIPVAEGHVRKVLGPAEEGTRVQIAVENVDPGKTCRLAPSDHTQVAYILEGKDARGIEGALWEVLHRHGVVTCSR